MPPHDGYDTMTTPDHWPLALSLWKAIWRGTAEPCRLFTDHSVSCV